MTTSTTGLSIKVARTERRLTRVSKSATRTNDPFASEYCRSLSGRSLAYPKVWQKAIRYVKRSDPILAGIIERVGPFKFQLDEDHYEALVGSIIFQQLAGSAARAILNRFKQLYGGKLPSPKEYLATDIEKLRGCGLSPQKISYLKDLSERLDNGKLDLRKFSEVSDEEVVRELDDVRGIGRWTAEMFLLFVLGRTDVLPVDDLGLQKAAKRAYRLRKLPRKEKFEQLAEKWHPYSSIATLYLWRSMEKPEAPAKW